MTLSISDIESWGAWAVGAAVTAVLTACWLRERRLRRRAETLRASERAGRIRAETKLAGGGGMHSGSGPTSKQGQGQQQGQQQKQKQQHNNHHLVRFECDAIGTLQSCFKQRNGTPRQSLLVPTARARLVLAPTIDRCALEGLADYSHCIVVFVFHANTNFHKTRDGDVAPVESFEVDEDGTNQEDDSTTTATTTIHYTSSLAKSCKARVAPPRMHGATTGVFATRSPHHPVPVGISIARIAAVDVSHGTIDFAGLDLVDGTPVLDVRPYVPHDAIAGPELRVPPWVAAPETRYAVALAPAAAARLEALFPRAAHASLYAAPDELAALVRDALARDIRSVARQQRHQDRHSIVLDTMRFQYAINEAAHSITVDDVQLALPD